MKHILFRKIILTASLGVLLVTGSVGIATAQGSPDPVQSDATGLQGTIPSPPPTTAASISVPVSGRTFTTTPITISGLCTSGLLVKVFSNNIFIGSAECTRGSYSLEADLFSGDNALIARVFDNLDQAGPDSNQVNVNFQDAQFAAFGQRISLTSTLAKLGAPVGSQLSWPILLSGGTGPYAISVDWGDGSGVDLKSVPFAGQINLTHIYKSAGIFRVVVKATDATGAAAFLQLVGVGAGDVTQSQSGTKDSAGTDTKIITRYIWWPILLMIPIILSTFWVGRRYEVVSIHRRIEQQAMQYENEIQR